MYALAVGTEELLIKQNLKELEKGLMLLHVIGAYIATSKEAALVVAR